ncbi:LLM class flavin-dependent oxidoreductase [Thioclava sp. BHET1]|uniref:Luciferase-like monooxygenase n=1 Tax=Thioclava dalianensis TaxID=1185766 RepID=A0A074TS63_9RHOB|nr:LLM class flavin-dependent oxidoreductase [Thioclava dalianensis]KEP71738.1 alkane 1-monooxygenase [Thioclava dalianensis]TMV90004.1 LLM class flavin-dependent oxidoreductase [Thioclava sp. BHET1]SFN40000.1 luciferase family oxidoreductase, group 1 [Thioclava dalianensis]
MIPYSVLDLSPIPQGATPADALANSVGLAQHVEALGYNRFWLAEHHNSTGIASAATAVVIGHVAGKTQKIRVGAGGIMLPNHAPLQVAEAFGTLETLYPGRIDLGLGRAPGTDPQTMQALRRGMGGGDRFPEDVVELLGYLGPEQEGARVRAVPGMGTQVPLWMLGSSLFGAQLAAHLGLPYAFASHFAPEMLDEAVEVYRQRFQPAVTQAPRFMLAVNLFAAATEAEGHLLRSSMLQSFINLRRGMSGPLPPPEGNLEAHFAPQEIAMADRALRIAAVGDEAQIEAQLRALIARYRPDEVLLTGHIFDQTARRESFRIGAQVMARINAEG